MVVSTSTSERWRPMARHARRSTRLIGPKVEGADRTAAADGLRTLRWLDINVPFMHTTHQAGSVALGATNFGALRLAATWYVVSRNRHGHRLLLVPERVSGLGAPNAD